MNEEIQSSKFDSIKWILVWGMLGSGIAVNYLFSGISPSLRLIFWLILSLLVFGVIFQTQKGKQWWVFLEEAKNELQKIVWPTRQETVQTTVVVVVMVIFSALFLWGVDALLIKCIQIFTGK
jgi:preprotein translocase subunit SecE